MTESDFDAKPSILLLGQYSTGKVWICVYKYSTGGAWPMLIRVGGYSQGKPWPQLRAIQASWPLTRLCPSSGICLHCLFTLPWLRTPSYPPPPLPYCLAVITAVHTSVPPPLSHPPPQTTFIKSLLGRDYPGSHIGPEPTTDRFVVVYHGMEERRVPGNTLAVQKDLPYQGLSSFGTGFLSRCGEVWEM